MNPRIDLSRFRAQASSQSGHKGVKVCLPKNTPFQIHPDPSVVMKSLWLALHEGQWHLVDKAIPETGLYVPGLKLWIADVYLGVLSDGTYCLVPVTYPSSDEYSGWRASLLPILSKARSRWMTMEPDREQGRYIGQSLAKAPTDMAWPQISEEWVINAFRGRIIGLNHPCMNKAVRHETVQVIEDDY
jgi:hypothetical protein